MSNKKDLTENMKLFCESYVVNKNAYKACLSAGYSENYAKGKSSALLKDERVIAYIEKLDKKFFIDKFENLSKLAVMELKKILIDKETTTNNRLKTIDMIFKYSKLEDKLTNNQDEELEILNDEEVEKMTLAEIMEYNEKIEKSIKK